MNRSGCNGLRLLIVGPYPPPFGGVASHLVTLLPGLRERGAEDVTLISFGDQNAVESIDGATLYRFAARDHARILARPRHWKALIATLRALRGSSLTVHALIAEATKTALINEIAEKHHSRVVSFYQSDMSLSLLPSSLLWGRQRGIVLTIFGECYDNPKFFTERRDFAQRLLSQPAAVVSSSKHCARSFAKIGVTRPVEAVYYGIDLDRFAAGGLREPYRQQLGVQPDELLVVYMGRFTDEMGIGRVLEIGPQLLERLPQAKLLLAGAKGPLADAASKFAASHSGRVIVLHDVPFSLQPSIYAASDILLAPSHDQHACMGMSIKEAMAAAKPVIGSHAGGIPEAIVDRETGLLIPLDNTKHVDGQLMLRAIEELGRDADLRARLGLAGRRRAEEIFSMERTIDRMGEIFAAALPR
jgi:glycosyltransferase involved in cell wall biosynthesis